MSEKNQYKDLAIKLSICIICGVLYSLAGWGEFYGGLKWLRRVVVPFLLTGGIFYYTRSWKSLITAPVLGLGFSLGYGHEETIFKAIKRGYCGFLIGLGSSIGYLLNKEYLFTIFQTWLVISFMIYLGVCNPFPARIEEFCIGFISSFLPLMNAKRFSC